MQRRRSQQLVDALSKTLRPHPIDTIGDLKLPQLQTEGHEEHAVSYVQTNRFESVIKLTHRSQCREASLQEVN